MQYNRVSSNSVQIQEKSILLKLKGVYLEENDTQLHMI